MIGQWLHGHRPARSGGLGVCCVGCPASFWPRPCKRLQNPRRETGPVSGNTAAYNKARPPVAAEHRWNPAAIAFFEQLTSEADGVLPGLRQRPSSSMAHRFSSLPVQPCASAIRPGSNQHGESHWPLLRMLVAHDLQTGLAMRPQWGPANGKRAVGEQTVAGSVHRPVAGLVAGGRGRQLRSLSVAYCGTQRGHCRTPAFDRRTRLAPGGRPVTGRDGSLHRLEAYPGGSAPPPPFAPGCLRAWTPAGGLVQPSNQAKPFLLAIFTTWDATPQQILDVYGQRWNIETDLRHAERHAAPGTAPLHHTGNGSQGNWTWRWPPTTSYVQ